MNKTEVQEFWGDLYSQLYSENDRELTPEKLERQVEELEDLFRRREQPCVVEMPLEDLRGLKVLEIGSGGGGHSCIFKRHGADIVAADITAPRVVSTALKFRLLKGGPASAIQADAEGLPFPDNHFDIIYSNGVIHHSPDTERCVEEIYRVLKPGGMAVVMLYSRISAVFMFNIFPRGILTGEIFRWPEAQWVGRLTEGKPKFGTTRNPITRVYTGRAMRSLFENFQVLGLRKWSFQFDNFCIPRLTQIRRWVLTRLGFAAHPGGIIVYGSPYVPETLIERFFGRFLGFCWVIKAFKPLD
jgi:ubiquinone/menaquinone biosynthesis C-methylase UbiE